MKTKGIFFDLYGTLLIYGDMSAAWGDWLAAFYDSLSEHGLSLSQESFARRCEGFFGRPEPMGRDEHTVLERRVQALCQDLGLELSTADIKRTGSVIVEAWQRYVSLDPDTIPLLHALQRKTELALITNFDHPPHIYSLLSRLGLGQFFHAVVISGQVGFKKPDSRIFAVALERVGLSRNDVVHVGDSPEDVQGARAAGISPILIERTRPDERPLMLDFGSNGEKENKASTTVDGVNTIARLTELLEVLP